MGRHDCGGALGHHPPGGEARCAKAASGRRARRAKALALYGRPAASPITCGTWRTLRVHVEQIALVVTDAPRRRPSLTDPVPRVEG